MKKPTTIALLLALAGCAADANAEILAVASTPTSRIYLTDDEGGCDLETRLPEDGFRRFYSTTPEGRNTGTGCYALSGEAVVVRWSDGGIGVLHRKEFAWLEPKP